MSSSPTGSAHGKTPFERAGSPKIIGVTCSYFRPTLHVVCDRCYAQFEVALAHPFVSLTIECPSCHEASYELTPDLIVAVITHFLNVPDPDRLDRWRRWAEDFVSRWYALDEVAPHITFEGCNLGACQELMLVRPTITGLIEMDCGVETPPDPMPAEK